MSPTDIFILIPNFRTKKFQVLSLPTEDLRTMLSTSTDVIQRGTISMPYSQAAGILGTVIGEVDTDKYDGQRDIFGSAG